MLLTLQETVVFHWDFGMQALLLLRDNGGGLTRVLDSGNEGRHPVQ